MEQCPQMSPGDAKWSKCGQLCPAVLIGVVELRWPCLLRADSGWCWEWGCVCSYRVPKHPATGVTGTGNNEGASLISEPEPFLIRWKTMLSFLCSLNRSCTSNSVLKLTCVSVLLCLSCSYKGRENVSQHLVLVYECVFEGRFLISSFCAWEATQWALLSFWMKHRLQTRSGSTAKVLL